ncbi:hypothetical protein IJ076_00945 [Candidatus Saccharibacteria bacterium]|nr:hypothetical protein [Candidatus Saccharibacteria bacterium]
MDGNPEGTPNPLNPMSQAGDSMDSLSSSDAETVNTEANEQSVAASDEVTNSFDNENTPARPASFAKPAVPVESGNNMPEMTETKTPSIPYVNKSVVDPMMRPVSHHPETSTTPVSKDASANNGDLVSDGILSAEDFSSLSFNNSPSVNSPSTAQLNDEPHLVAKDSIVEPANKKGGKKKALIIGAIILVMTAIICGAAAIAIFVLGNSDDRVTKAIDKLLNGGMSSIVNVQGDISLAGGNNSLGSEIVALSSANVNVDGTFDVNSLVNKVSAEITAEASDGTEFSLSVDEMRTKDNDTYFKISGLMDIFGGSNVLEVGEESTSLYVDEDCDSIACDDEGNCVSCESTAADVAASALSSYSGIFETIDDEWILISDDFADTMGGLVVFNNSSTCLINAFGTLPEYAKDIANKYKANPFITYSTNNLEIAKKKHNLYKLGIDDGKMSAFVNSLGNNGFINELKACVDENATNVSIDADAIKSIFSNFPIVYVEINDNNDFTRVYLKTTGGSENGAISAKADLALSYPSEVTIAEPVEYVDMSTILSTMMTNVFSGGIVQIKSE